MKKCLQCFCTVLLPLLGACSSDTDFPREASAEELKQIFQSRAATLQDVGRADQVRSYGIFLERDDGRYTASKGRVLVFPDGEDAYLLAYYMPVGDERFERIGEPLRVEGTATPRTGSPRGTATCLRAPLTGATGEWYGCVDKGRLITGTE